MARGKAHSDEVRAQVMAALLAGQGVTEVAAKFKVNERVIRRWREGELSEVVRQKKERIGTLIFDYLAENLTCLRAQLKVASDGNYLKKQPASELATLHGVIADKGFKILEALDRTEEDPGAEP